MKVKTKQTTVMVLSIVALVLIIPSILTSILHLAGIQEYPIVEIEGIQTLSVNAQIICIFLSLITNIFILILSRNIVKNKITIILLSIFQFLIGNPIIAGAIIIIMNKKTDDVEEVVKLPSIEKTLPKHPMLYILLFLLGYIINYSPLYMYCTEIIENEIVVAIISLVFMILSSVCIVYPIIMIGKEILSDLKVFRKNFKAYMEYIIPKLGIFLIIYYIVALIIQLIVRDIPTNQEMINEMPIWQSAVLALFYAPLAEEAFFRGFLRRGIKNNKLFIIISAVVFGITHIMIAEENILVYLYSIVYITIGYFLAKMYIKTENIVSNMFLHFLWNAIGIVTTVLTLF